MSFKIMREIQNWRLKLDIELAAAVLVAEAARQRPLRREHER